MVILALLQYMELNWKDYIDENFAKEGNSISMWRVYNLLTGANKSSYIDNFLDRSLNATQLTEGLSRAVQGDSEYRWFID